MSYPTIRPAVRNGLSFTFLDRRYVSVVSVLVTASFRCTLKFTVRDCDPATGEPDAEEGFPDEYVVSTLPRSIVLELTGLLS